jgi:hypothetical protein
LEETLFQKGFFQEDFFCPATIYLEIYITPFTDRHKGAKNRHKGAKAQSFFFFLCARLFLFSAPLCLCPFVPVFFISLCAFVPLPLYASAPVFSVILHHGLLYIKSFLSS